MVLQTWRFGVSCCVALGLWACAFSGWAYSLQQDLAARYSDRDIVAVMAGEQPVTVVRQPATIALERGIAIILTEPGYQGLTLQAAETLAARMNRWGWQTLLVLSPALTGAPLAAGTDAAQPDQYTDSTTSWLDANATETHITLLLNALNQQIADVPGYRMIIAQGMTAAQLIKLNAEDRIAPPDTLVTITPFWPDNATNRQLASLVKATTSPLLDITGAINNRWEQQTRLLRRRQATTALKMHYRQREMATDLGGHSAIKSVFANQLSKQIYGWTRHLGW